MGNDLKDDQRYVCNIWNEGIDDYRWDRPRSLGVATVRIERDMSSTLHVQSIVASAFCVTLTDIHRNASASFSLRMERVPVAYHR
jgi:hypothetical protein